METLDSRLQLVAIVASALLLLFILELVRRRRLGEPYALIWLLAGVVLLTVSVFDGLLDEIADLVGVEVPSNALFAVAFGFVFVLLLSFSVIVSRLSRENKLLAQELARLNEELRRERAERPRPAPPRGSPPGSDPV